MSWFCSADLGIDLGSSEIRIYQRGKGLLLSEANTVLIVKNKAVAWGWEAQNSDSAAGELFCPVQQGRIIDSELTYKMLQIFFRQAGLKKITSRDRLLILVPQELSGLQRLTLNKIFHQLGFNQIYLAASVMAVALANHLKSSLVIDLGQERTDLAIVVPEGIVSGCSLAWGSRHLDQALLSYFQDNYNLNWDEKTVECLKREQITLTANQTVEWEGQQIVLSQLIPILHQVLQPLQDQVREMLRQLDPELAGELWGKGLLLAGQGALLDGLEMYLGQAVGVAVVLAEEIQPISGTNQIWDIIDSSINPDLLSSWLQEGN